MVLLSPQDLARLSKKDLGLRLTSNTHEAKRGGIGDAIPLSHLAGANDIIEFLTLSFLPKIPRDKLEALYNQYKESEIQRTDCMPRLILYYAAQHNISDARARVSYKKNNEVTENSSKFQHKALASEAKKLVSFYRSSSVIYPLELVVQNLPHLAQELAHNFNEKLQLRLKLNWQVYVKRNDSDDMDYLFLTSDHPNLRNYAEGYDFNNYPLGKIGRCRFESANVIKQVKFFRVASHTLDPQKTTEERIFKSIKWILNSEFYSSLELLQQTIQRTHYPDNFATACNEMLALIVSLRESQQLSSEEAVDLLNKTKSLIANPADYKTFLTEAKKYRMVAQGQLSAYMMLIAGWAAKIMTCNCRGNAWIRLATEKLDYFATTKAFADTSEAYSKSMVL